MKAQNITIDALTGAVELPSPLLALHDTTFTLRVAFREAGIFGPITDYTASSIRLGIKDPAELNATTSLIGSGTWTVEGSGATTRYVLEVEMDSTTLRTFLGTEDSKLVQAQIAWQITGDDNERKSQPFEILIINSVTLSEDGAPDTAADASWTWLKARLPAGTRIRQIINESAKTIEISGLIPDIQAVASDTALNNSADTTLLTFAVEANKQYRLDLSLAAYVQSGSRIRLWGIPPSGSTVRGRWRNLEAAGIAENVRPHVFGELTNNHVIDAQNASVSGNLAAPNQTFIINVGSTAGNVVIYGRSTSASGDSILSGSFGHLTQLSA